MRIFATNACLDELMKFSFTNLNALARAWLNWVFIWVYLPSSFGLCLVDFALLPFLDTLAVNLIIVWIIVAHTSPLIGCNSSLVSIGSSWLHAAEYRTVVHLVCFRQSILLYRLLAACWGSGWLTIVVHPECMLFVKPILRRTSRSILCNSKIVWQNGLVF